MLVRGQPRHDVSRVRTIIAHDTLDAGIGLTLHIAKDASFDLSYQSQFARHAVDNQLQARCVWKF